MSMHDVMRARSPRVRSASEPMLEQHHRRRDQVHLEPLRSTTSMVSQRHVHAHVHVSPCHSGFGYARGSERGAMSAVTVAMIRWPLPVPHLVSFSSLIMGSLTT